MMELLQKAWAGWGDYITQGKLAALLLMVLLFLWFTKRTERQKRLIIYTTIAVACCIFPVTAAVLLGYQTRFYDYEWIWSVVPATAVTAYGMTIFLTDFLTKEGPERKVTKVSVALVCLSAIFLCGTLGAKKDDSYSAYMNVLYPYQNGGSEEMFRRQAYEAVEDIQRITGDGEVVLWAPIEVMEYAREADARIRLLYGRNMWDDSLGAYSYDTYDETLYNLYLWIETADGSLDLWSEQLREEAASLPEAEDCVKKARELGVNCVLLSLETDEETVQMVADIFGAKAQQTEEYWVIYG